MNKSYSSFIWRLAAICLIASWVACAGVSAQPVQNTEVRFIDTDGNGTDSPGDVLTYGNSLITLKFRFVELASERRNADAKFNGYYLDSATYRGEKCFQHPDWKTEHDIYPTILTNDVVGMSAFLKNTKLYIDNPFLWMWNARGDRSALYAKLDIPGTQEGLKQSFEWYTLYSSHRIESGALVFVSNNARAKREEVAYSIDGDSLTIKYTAFNNAASPMQMTGVTTFPANRIIDTMYTPPDMKVVRKITPTAFTDNYTFFIEKSDGYSGSGMLLWSIGKDTLLHMNGLFSWFSFSVPAGGSVSKSMTIRFKNQNIDSYYADYLAANKIKFDPIDWDETEKYLVSKLPLVIVDDGYVYHSFEYNAPKTTHDWHNEMTGRATIVQYLASGGAEDWLDLTSKLNRHYDYMLHKDPKHVCYGYFRDVSYGARMFEECYPWSQPYNVESYIAEYAVTKSDNLKRALLRNFDKMYGGPLYNAAGQRWLWKRNGAKRYVGDYGVFDAQEFGADVMVSAYEFTGDRKYLDRAVEAMRRNKFALDNFGLLLEDTSGMPSVNTSAFAAKLLFKLHEYTGNEYWKERAVKILNATLYSRVYMEPYPPEDEWLNGALARKDADWIGNTGEPRTGTDCAVPSETTYIPWVMEALVAGYNHTGNEMYIRYMEQMLHHQLELNKRASEATHGIVELCGHYNMYNGQFDTENDGLTVVSNLFLFPYVKAFRQGFRSPHSSIVLMPGAGNSGASVRAYHLSGISEKVSVLIPPGKKAARVAATAIDGKNARSVGFKSVPGGVSFTAAPYQMYAIIVK